MKRVFVIALAMLFVSWAGMACAQSPGQGPAPSGPAMAQQGAAPSGPALMQHGPGHPGGNDNWGRMRHRMARFLNLTKEQQDKMREIRQRFLTDTHDVRYDLQVKRIEMRKLFTDPKTADEALLAKQKEIDTLIIKLMDTRAAMKVEWRKVLTPEQLQKLDKAGFFKAHRHSRFMQ